MKTFSVINVMCEFLLSVSLRGAARRRSNLFSIKDCFASPAMTRNSHMTFIRNFRASDGAREILTNKSDDVIFKPAYQPLNRSREIGKVNMNLKLKTKKVKRWLKACLRKGDRFFYCMSPVEFIKLCTTISNNFKRTKRPA